MNMTERDLKTSAWVQREPNLSDVLNDPVVRAMMLADGVDPNELARILGIPVRTRRFGGVPGQAAASGSAPADHAASNTPPRD